MGQIVSGKMGQIVFPREKPKTNTQIHACDLLLVLP